MTTERRFQSRDVYYGALADARMAAYVRDPIIDPSDHGRAAVANGKRGRWGRYNDPSTLVYATNIYGVTHGLTRNQVNLLGEVQRISGTATRTTMRALADALGTTPSTIYRAAVRLQALGFIAYQSNRGRLGGSMFLVRVARDGLDWARDAARMTLRKWWKASEARISRLRGNVASMFPDRRGELYQYHYISNSTERNIYREWSVEDFREAGLM